MAKAAPSFRVTPPSGNSILRYAMLVCALTLPIVAASYYLLVGQNVESAEDGRQQQLSQLFANQQQSVLNAEISQIRSRLEGLTSSPALQRIGEFQHKDLRRVDAAHRLFEANLLQAFPEAKSLNYVPITRLGTAGIRNSDRFRNNIELDIIQRTSFTKSWQIEAYRFEKDWLVSFAQWAEPNVVLMVTVPVTHFRSVMRNASADKIQVTLNQAFQGKRHVITSVAVPDPSDKMTPRPLDVPGWTVEVRLSKVLESALSENRFAYWVLCAISMALILLTGLSIAIWFEKMLNADTANFAKAKESDFKFAAIAQLKANLLAKKGAVEKQKAAKHGHRPSLPPKPVSSGMVIEEIPAETTAKAPVININNISKTPKKD